LVERGRSPSSPGSRKSAIGGERKENTENVNLKAAFIHVVGDCLQSLGVIVAAVVIWVGNEVNYGSPTVQGSWYNIADPIASLIFGIITLGTTRKRKTKEGKRKKKRKFLIVLFFVVRILKQTVDVLMEKVPDHIDYDDVKNEFLSIPNVLDVTGKQKNCLFLLLLFHLFPLPSRHAHLDS
jgi:zinc transporter 2